MDIRKITKRIVNQPPLEIAAQVAAERPEHLPRAPLDWMFHPVNETHRDYYLLSETPALDFALQRLYTGSPTYRALLATFPTVKKSPVTVSQIVPTADFFFYRGSVESSSAFLEKDKDKNALPWMLAYHYRRGFQQACGISSQDIPARPASLRLAFNRIAQADRHAYAATCLFEMLYNERTPETIIMNLFRGTPLRRVFQQTVYTSLISGNALWNGLASTAGFQAFFAADNAYTLKKLDQKAIKVLPEADNDNRSSAVPANLLLEGKFSLLQSLPFLDAKSDQPRERDRYLEGLSLSDFSGLKYTGIANRLRLALI